MLQNLTYTYDPVGNVTGISDGVLGESQVFAYDGLDRLVSGSMVSPDLPWPYPLGSFDGGEER